MAQAKSGNKGNSNKGGNGKGSPKTIAERQTAAKAVADNKRAVKAQKDKARSAAGPAWYIEQNAGKSSDKESFIAGLPGPYTFPGGDKPSVHLDLEYRPNKDGTKRELTVVYLHAHEGYTHEGYTFEDHPLMGLRKETFVKAAWLSKPGFQSTAPNPQVKKAQDAIIGYLREYFGGEVVVQNTLIDIEKDERVSAKTNSNTAPAKSASVVTEFVLENEATTDKGKTGQISFEVKAGKVVITLFRSAKYGGKDWGYVPTNAYLHMPDGGNRCLWDIHQPDKSLEFFYNLIQTADDGFIVIGTKGRSGKDQMLFTTVSLKSETEKVEVVGNDDILILHGGMNAVQAVIFKQKVAKLLSANPRFTAEEDVIRAKLNAAQSKMSAKRKADEAERKAREAGERQAKLMASIEENPVVVYNERGEGLEVLEVDNDHVAKLFNPGIHVVIRNKGGSPAHKVVRRSASGHKYLVDGEKVTFERPTFEGKAKVLAKKMVYVNDVHGVQEIALVPDRQAVVTLRAQGMNGGAYVAYLDETDGNTVINQVFADRIEEVLRTKELEAF